MSNPWDYDLWPSRSGTESWRGSSQYDLLDFHVDLGCGRVPKGRIGVDRYAAEGVAVIAELDCECGALTYSVADHPGADAPAPTILAAGSQRHLHTRGLPFATSSIKSIISHHFFEHVGEGFIPLVGECYRVLEPGGILRAITPLFPSASAVADPDHCRYFMEDTWMAFCGTPGETPQNCWLASFSVPYTSARFELAENVCTPRSPEPSTWWSRDDVREIRVALKAMK